MLRGILLFLARWCFAPARRRPIVTARVTRVLVVRLCCLGDVLFTTPLLRALRANFPRAHLGYLVSPWCRKLLDVNPHVDRVIEYDPYGPGSRWERWRRAWRAVRTLRAGAYDLAVVLHRTPWAGLLAAAAGIPLRVGFDWEGQGVALTHPVPFRGGLHEVDRALECLKPLGAAPEGRDLELPVPAEAESRAEDLLRGAGWRGDAGPLVALFPGGGVNPGTSMTSKRWSAKGYQEVGRRLAGAFGARFVLVGAEDDRAAGDAALPPDITADRILRLEGRTDLLATAAVLQRCALFLGGDSGPLYMAAAVGTPTVAVFGPSDPDLVAPRGDDHRVVRKSLPCSPCYTPDTVHRAEATVCRLGTNACLQADLTDAVWQAAAEQLERKGYPRA